MTIQSVYKKSTHPCSDVKNHHFKTFFPAIKLCNSISVKKKEKEKKKKRVVVTFYSASHCLQRASAANLAVRCAFRVVSVGGDGMFNEILHGLAARTQREHGIDANRPDARLAPCSLRIGIIPAGEPAW